MARWLVAVLVLVAVAASLAAGTPEKAPQRGGTLVIGTRTQSEPACLNVFTCGPWITVSDLMAGVLPGAFEVMPDGRFRPDLVAEAEIVSKRPFTVVYRIRPEARWSDGVRVTASDFVFTDRVRRSTSPDPEDWHRLYVRDVTALDGRTVRVELRARSAAWRYLFDIVLPRHALDGEDFEKLWKDDVTDPHTGRPIGSGPFLVERFERGRQLTFVRNPRYWGPHPAYLERIVFRFLPPEEVGDALSRGEIDLIDPGPGTLRAAATGFYRTPVPGVTTLFSFFTHYEQLTIRTHRGGHPALASPLVRRALAFGIDRAAIARTIGRFFAPSTITVGPADSVVFVPSSRYYRPNWKHYRHRPAEARRLLEQAGCRIGQDGVYVCGGSRLSLRFVTVMGNEGRERTAVLVKNQLSRSGVEVTPVFANPATLGEILESGSFDLFLIGFGRDDLGSGLDMFMCGETYNYSGYCDRRITRDLAPAPHILDGTRRAELLNGVDMRLAKGVPGIPLFQAGGFIALKAIVRGVVRGAYGSDFWNIEDWWLDR